MKELSVSEIDAVSGGDGVATAAGILVGVVAGALVIRSSGGIVFGAFAGLVIFAGTAAYLRSNMAR